MTAPSAVLPRHDLLRHDFLRAPVLATARPDGFKEWHHFVVHHPDLRLLINFSLMAETLPGRAPRLVPRVIVVAHDGRWQGGVERYDHTATAVSADLSTLTAGRNRMSVAPGGYRLSVHLPDSGIFGHLDLTPTGGPTVVAVTNKPLGAGRLNWLFVPRLRAEGWFRIGDRHRQLAGAVAYHDHNWGRFRWGDDFGWTWGSILPSTPQDPWSFVFVRMTDRRRLRCLSQALYVWHHGELAALFRDAAVDMRSTGRFGRPADTTLPAAMRLVLGGDAADVPECVEITATRTGAAVHATFRPSSWMRLAQPSEVHLDRSVVLSEAVGPARVVGSVGGVDLDVTGTGTVETLHG